MDISYRDYRIQENLKALREPMRVFMSKVQLFQRKYHKKWLKYAHRRKIMKKRNASCINVGREKNNGRSID